MEVGRSCHILKYKGKVVMLDAGVHPAYEGIASLPFYDEFDLSTVDILLISQYVLHTTTKLQFVKLHKLSTRFIIFALSFYIRHETRLVVIF